MFPVKITIAAVKHIHRKDLSARLMPYLIICLTSSYASGNKLPSDANIKIGGILIMAISTAVSCRNNICSLRREKKVQRYDAMPSPCMRSLKATFHGFFEFFFFFISSRPRPNMSAQRIAQKAKNFSINIKFSYIIILSYLLS